MLMNVNITGHIKTSAISSHKIFKQWKRI